MVSACSQNYDSDAIGVIPRVLVDLSENDHWESENE